MGEIDHTDALDGGAARMGVVLKVGSFSKKISLSLPYIRCNHCLPASHSENSYSLSVV